MRTAIRRNLARRKVAQPRSTQLRTSSTRQLSTAAATASQESSVRVPPPDGISPIAPLRPPPSPPETSSRLGAIKNAKPFSAFLTDTFNRQHTYLRISITERCNLRCLYCMPAEGIQLSPSEHLLTTPEIVYLASLFVSQGVNKIRLTGGEPTVRKDIVELMRRLGDLRARGLKELALTSNGILLHRHLDTMVEAGLTGVNLSLDTLDPFQFQLMTRRKGFEHVMRSIERVLDMKRAGASIKLKINCVVMRGLNDGEILDFVELAKEKDIEIRFIEYMPFDGNKWSQGKMVGFAEMLDRIKERYPGVHRIQGHPNDTSKTYAIPGFLGKVGFITSMTNDFCGTCNRLRITGDGNLKVCLHGNAEVSLRDVLREGNNGRPINQEAFEKIRNQEIDRAQGKLDDSTPFGWGERERKLLQVIGTAVKSKKEKHAGMGELENMKNRPMILIGDHHSPTPMPFTKGLCSPKSARPVVDKPWSRILPHMLRSSPVLFMRTTSTTSQTSTSSQVDTQNPVTDKTVRILFRKGSAGENGSGVIVNATRAGDGTGLRDGHDHDARNRSADKRPKSLGNFVVRKHFARISAPKLPPAHKPAKIRVDLEASSLPKSSSVLKESLSSLLPVKPTNPQTPNNLPHLTSDGSAHMVSVISKNPTHRVAVAVGTVFFSAPEIYRLIRENLVQKGDVLGTARIAGIMGAKHTPVLVPLCHPIVLSGVAVDVKLLPPNGTDTGMCRATSSIEDKSWELADIARRCNSLESKQNEFTENLESVMRELVKLATRAQQSLHHSEVNKRVNQEGNQEQVVFLKDLEEMMEKGTEAIASLKGAQSGFQNAFNHLKQSVKAFNPESNATSNLGDQDGDCARNSNSHGCVRIEAKVECVGPTGVEMEALTAVSAAALTVIDMVKAVDRNARVDGVKMVMKKGGRSGVHIDQLWAQDPNRVYDMN